MPKNSIEWMKTITRPTSPLKASEIIKGGINIIPEKTGAGLNNHLIVPVNNNKHAYWVDSGEFKKFAGKMSSLSNDLDFLDSFAEECESSADELIQISKELKAKCRSGFSLEEIKDIWFRYHDKVVEHSSYYAWGFLPIEKNLTGKFQEKLEEECSGNADKYKSIFMKKRKPNFKDKERISLLQIEEKARNKGEIDEEIKDEIKKHTEEYGWYPVYDYKSQPWDTDYFLKRLRVKLDKDKRKFEQEKNQFSQIRSKIKENLESLDPSPELKRQIELIQRYIYLRTYRTDALRLAYYNTKSFLRKIAEEFEWKNKFIPYLTCGEINNYLKTSQAPSFDEVKRRSKNFLMRVKRGKLETVTEENEIEQMKKKLDIGKEILLRGNGVHPGRVKGEVKIIEGYKEEDKLNEGDILVSSMTTPDMMPLIQKARAIITDEGGITSHAAVAARELGIPCVIGTENATSILNDGDKVEVNAEEGSIKKREENE